MAEAEDTAMNEAFSLSFERTEGCESQVSVRLHLGLACLKPCWVATADCGTGIARELTLQYLEREFAARLQEIRRLAYHAGYRDKTKKRPKRTLHAGCLRILDWEREAAGEGEAMSRDKLIDAPNVEVVATDLRALLFWATVGVNSSVDGQYSEEIEEIIRAYSECIQVTNRARFKDHKP